MKLLEPLLPELQNKPIQEFFDIAWNHAVVKQSPMCRVGGSCACAYRDDKGNRCLIGAAIPDERYSLEMEGLAASGLIFGESHRDSTRSRQINELQRCHDSISPIHNHIAYLLQVESNLIKFSERHGMKIPGER